MSGGLLSALDMIRSLNYKSTPSTPALYNDPHKPNMEKVEVKQTQEIKDDILIEGTKIPIDNPELYKRLLRAYDLLSADEKKKYVNDMEETILHSTDNASSMSFIDNNITYPIKNGLKATCITDKLTKIENISNKKLSQIIEQDIYFKRHIPLKFEKDTPYDECEKIFKLAYEKYCEYFNIIPINTPELYAKKIDNLQYINGDYGDIIRREMKKLEKVSPGKDYADMKEHKYISIIECPYDVMKYMGCDVYVIIFHISFITTRGKQGALESKVDMIEYKNQLHKFSETYPELKIHIVRDYEHNRFIKHIDNNIDYEHYAEQSLFVGVNTGQNMQRDVCIGHTSATLILMCVLILVIIIYI